MQRKYLVDTYRNRGLTFVAGEGAFLIDSSGDKYLDLMTNYGVNIYGYNPAPINERLIDQLTKLSVLHASFNNDSRAQAAMSLVKRCGGGLSRVYFSNSGSEAIEAALKFAVLATGRKKFLVCRNGYHGKTLGALSATSGETYREPFEPLLWAFQAIDYDDISQLEAAIDEDTAAFLVEPIQGEGGIIIPEKGYLKRAQEVCVSRNVLMVVDEIQTGNGRTGHFTASEIEGLTFDILCLGKGLASGLPVGATLVSSAISENIPKGIHTSTFGGNPLAGAGVLATLDFLTEDLLDHVQNTGQYFTRQLHGIKSDIISEIRGQGLMIGLDVKRKRDKILQDLQRERILAAPAGQNVIRFLPPYIISRRHVDRATEKLEKVLRALEE